MCGCRVGDDALCASMNLLVKFQLTVTFPKLGAPHSSYGEGIKRQI
jgi:hypothetical protein